MLHRQRLLYGRMLHDNLIYALLFDAGRRRVCQLLLTSHDCHNACAVYRRSCVRPWQTRLEGTKEYDQFVAQSLSLAVSGMQRFIVASDCAFHRNI